MKKSLFIGIDFSKKKFDVSVLHQANLLCADYHQFDNNKEGCLDLLRWIQSLTKEPCTNWLFCGEHTGLYSIYLSEFLIKKGLFVWLENPLQIKQSSGIRREKATRLTVDTSLFMPIVFRTRRGCMNCPAKCYCHLNSCLPCVPACLPTSIHCWCRQKRYEA